jgi:hypothetical protein
MMSMKRIDAARSTAAALLAVGASLLTAPAAQAQEGGGSSCQTDFQKYMGPRMGLIQRINGFQRRRPTPQQACSTLNSLVAADARLIKWMGENKDWCQIPDSVVEQVQASSGQAVRARGQACNAVKQQAAMIARARAAQARAQAQQGGGGPAPVGSGVRLPQGAL